MRKIWCLCVLMMLVQVFYAQSWDKKVLVLDDQVQPNQYDGDMPLYGALLKHNGVLEKISESQKGIYTVDDYGIYLENSKAVILLFDGITLLEGEYLEIQTEKGFYRKFSGRSLNGKLNTGIIEGQEIRIQCFLLKKRSQRLYLNRYVLFHDSELNHLISSHKDYGESDNCNVNISCPLADPIREKHRSTARILLIVEEGMGWCTGSLMNNTRRDGTPYFLTAFHCQDGFTPLFDFWKFDFLYEYEACGGRIDEPVLRSLTGCERTSGRQSSDFLLLQLLVPPPLSYQPYYNGWNHIDQPANALLLSHHPNGDVKKVTSYGQKGLIRSNNSSLNWTNGVVTPPNHHWYAAHDEGMFEPGSSGGPAYDQNGYVIGQLHGGAIDCETGASYFGKLSRSWSDGVAANERLDAWLSPDSAVASLESLDFKDRYCIGTTQMTDLSGSVNDGSLLDQYLPFTNCNYSIVLPEDYIIELDFDFLMLDPSDTLKIFDDLEGTVLLGAFSGEYRNRVVLSSSGNEVLVQFVTDADNENEGFRFFYEGKRKETTIQGTVKTPNGSLLEKVEIFLRDHQYRIRDTALTDELGRYEFNVPSEESIFYLQAKFQDPNIREGISLLDKLQFLNYFRGIINLDDPFQRLAADIDRSGVIDRRDLIYYRFIEDELVQYWPSSSQLWSFYNTSQLPYTADEVLGQIYDRDNWQITVNLSTDTETEKKNYNFTGIKTGDINLSR